MSTESAGEEISFRELTQEKDEQALVDADGLAMLGGSFSGLVNIKDLAGDDFTQDFVRNPDGTYSTVMCAW